MLVLFSKFMLVTVIGIRCPILNNQPLFTHSRHIPHYPSVFLRRLSSPLLSSRSTTHTAQKAIVAMLRAEVDTQERVQAIRPFYNTSPAQNAPITATDHDVVHVTIHLDNEGRGIVIWEDVQFALKGAVNIRHGTKILPFLRGSDFRGYVTCTAELVEVSEIK